MKPGLKNRLMERKKQGRKEKGRERELGKRERKPVPLREINLSLQYLLIDTPSARCRPRRSCIRLATLPPCPEISGFRPVALRPTLSDGLPFSGEYPFLGIFFMVSYCNAKSIPSKLAKKMWCKSNPLSWDRDFFIGVTLGNFHKKMSEGYKKRLWASHPASPSHKAQLGFVIQHPTFFKSFEAPPWPLPPR